MDIKGKNKIKQDLEYITKIMGEPGECFFKKFMRKSFQQVRTIQWRERETLQGNYGKSRLKYSLTLQLGESQRLSETRSKSLDKINPNCSELSCDRQDEVTVGGRLLLLVNVSVKGRGSKHSNRGRERLKKKFVCVGG